MASLAKRNGNYSIVFKTRLNGKSIKKTYALGTKYKKIAEQKKVEYEKRQELEGTAVTSLIKKFLKEKTNVTEKTKRTYEQILTQSMDQVARTMPVRLVDTNDIREFCFRDDLANASKKNYLRHLKVFFNWLVQKGYIETNPCDDIRLPKTRKNLVDKIIEEEDLKIIFKKFRDYQLKHKKARAIQSHEQMQLWFKPLITLAFYTDLRRKEIIQLRWEHINLENRFLRVTDTKNGSERTVSIFDPLYWRLKAWEKMNDNPQKGLVFPSPKSNSKIEIALTSNTVVPKVFKFYATERSQAEEYDQLSRLTAFLRHLSSA